MNHKFTSYVLINHMCSAVELLDKQDEIRGINSVISAVWYYMVESEGGASLI